jgi:Methyltransferase domain
MDESRAGRALAVLAYCASVVVRSPGEARRLAKMMGSRMLDVQFEQASPLPVLDDALARRLQRDSVTFPAPGLLTYGNQSLDGLVHLVSLARLVEARCIFEIGTYNGFTALTLARNLKDSVIHTLDLPTGEEPGRDVNETDRGHIRYLSKNPGRVYVGTDEEQRIVQHLEDSATFDFSSFKSRCELVYVDGAHSFDYVKGDTEAALEMVSSRGIVVWDDYSRMEPDVPRYLDLHAPKPLVRLPRSRLVVWFSDGAARRLRELASFSESPA